MKNIVNDSLNRKPKEFFESELDRILNIHFDAKYYFMDIEYILNPSSIEEKIVSNSLFIERLIHAFWRLGIIEISKLFQKSKNQHYNLIDYLEELIEFYDECEWIKNLSKNKLLDWLDLINSAEFKSIRNKIRIQRNNYYAHLDKNPEKDLKEVSIELVEINKLLKLTEDILYELNLSCLGIDCDFDVSGMEKAGYILEAFVALKEKKKMKIQEARNKYLKVKIE